MTTDPAITMALAEARIRDLHSAADRARLARQAAKQPAPLHARLATVIHTATALSCARIARPAATARCASC